MAIAAVIVQIMPSSIEADLDIIQSEAKLIMEKHHAQNITFEVKPIAFGLKSIMMKMAWPEKQNTDVIENELAAIENVSSVTIEDYRRAFG